MIPVWFEPTVSREAAESRLRFKHVGGFLIRQSSQPGTLALSLKTGNKEDDIKHFIIVSRDGSVALEDSELEFDSLVSLVNHYSSNRDELPVSLRMTSASSRKISAPAGLHRADSPMVSMVGRQRTKSTIWVNSPVFKNENNTRSRDIEVINSVLKQDSKLDNQFSALLSDWKPLDTDRKDTKDPSEDPAVDIGAIEADAYLENETVKADISDKVEDVEVNAVKDAEKQVKDAMFGIKDSSKEAKDVEKDNVEVEDDYSLPVDLENDLYEIPGQAGSWPSPRRDSPTSAVPAKTNGGGRPRLVPNSASLPEKPIRYRKNNSVVNHHFSQKDLEASEKLSKSCSNIFEELEKRNEINSNNKNFRKSFVRKVSLNLSVRKTSTSRPIRKISAVMKKMLPINKISSLVNSQENSDSWEYLADCGVSPVYEEVQEVKRLVNDEDNIYVEMTTPDPPANRPAAAGDVPTNLASVDPRGHSRPNKEEANCDRQASLKRRDSVDSFLALEKRCSEESGSCDSVYESECSSSNSNPSSLGRQSSQNITRILLGGSNQDRNGRSISQREPCVVHYV